MSKLILRKDRKINVRALFAIIQEQWERTIKHEKGQVILQRYTAPCWGNCVLISIEEKLAKEEIGIAGLLVRGIIPETFEKLELFIPCDKKHMVGSDELMAIGLEGEESNIHNPLLRIMLELAFGLEMVERKRAEPKELRNIAGAFFI